MDIELEFKDTHWILIIPLALVLVVGLSLLGRTATPSAGGILTPEDWRVQRGQRAHMRELAALRDASEDLVELVNLPPDPVRAGLTADRISQLSMGGHPSLEVQRDSLLEAAEAVRLWAMGGASRTEAVAAVERAIVLLRMGPERER